MATGESDLPRFVENQVENHELKSSLHIARWHAALAPSIMRFADSSRKTVTV